jgi:hypothetical protein
MAARYFLWATSIVFAAFGLWGLISPVDMVTRFGIELPGGDSRTMIRASYGGFLLGEAALFAYCAMSLYRVRIGLVAVILLTSPILAARLIGMAIDGGQFEMHAAYLAIEALGIAIAVVLLRRHDITSGAEK